MVIRQYSLSGQLYRYRQARQHISIEEAEFDAVTDVNLKGTYNICKFENRRLIKLFSCQLFRQLPGA
jgi:NAD(P)-dependent dehydrogenase (short-subunit alcohol dehydrogenase family)